MLVDKLNHCIHSVVSEFIQRYRLSFTDLDESVYEDLEKIMNKILNATIKGDEVSVKQYCEELAFLNFQHNIPYVILINELNILKSTLTNELLLKNAKDEIYKLHLIYNNVENIISYEHLKNYLERLFRLNLIRINSLKDVMKKNLITHYQAHLEWLNDLTIAIKNNDINLVPQLHSHKCNFGKWLNTDGKLIIKNNSKYKMIVSHHNNLHSFANVIEQQLQKKYKNHNILMSYLEKCEFVSLSIGTELALLENRLLISESSKDKMTGALNRNSLDSLFSNQYEISLATNTHFVFALCDLDLFKNLNDTYGHVAGDKVLKQFVEITKQTLRDSDIIARYGGEEFVIILPNSNIENGNKKLNAVRENFKNFCCIEQKKLNVSVSIGAIEITPKENIHRFDIDMNIFIQMADEKLYRAKADGRDKVVC